MTHQSSTSSSVFAAGDFANSLNGIPEWNTGLMIPALVEHSLSGWKILPPGIHDATIEEIRQRFVDEIQSVKRPELFKNWLAWRVAMKSLIPVEEEYLDGSFVTSRVNPKDIDVSLWTDGEAMSRLPAPHQDAIEKLTGIGGFNLFSVDSYLVPRCPTGHALHESFVDIRDWTGEAWATARDNRQRNLEPHLVRKGYLRIIE